MKKPSQWLLYILNILLFGFLYLLGSPGSVLAAEPTPSDDEVNSIARQLYCPVCENTPLDVCDSDACRQWRDLIRQMLAEGKTSTEIQEYFKENYGIRVLSQPPAEGFGWLAYIVPIALFFAGVILFVRTIMRWRKHEAVLSQDPDSQDANPSYDEKYRTMFEEEINKRD
jgi:cytochrome c-type biogenesis protein CcmH